MSPAVPPTQAILTSAELMDGGEHVNQLVEALGEQVKLEEDGLQ